MFNPVYWIVNVSRRANPCILSWSLTAWARGKELSKRDVCDTSSVTYIGFLKMFSASIQSKRSCKFGFVNFSLEISSVWMGSLMLDQLHLTSVLKISGVMDTYSYIKRKKRGTGFKSVMDRRIQISPSTKKPYKRID